MTEAADPRQLISTQTAVVRPRTLPELLLHLVTPEQPWWRAMPEDLLPLGVVDPYWAFCWPGGTALARYILDHPDLVRGRRVYDLGAGSGVAGLAAAIAGAAQVVVNDIDTWALVACELNAALNDLSVTTDARDLIGTDMADCDVLLLGDVSYSKELVTKLWPWLQQLASTGKCVLLADPGRGFLPPGLRARASLRVPAEIDDDGEHTVDVAIIQPN